MMRPMFGAFGKAGSANSTAFVGKVAAGCGIKNHYGLTQKVEAVGNVRILTKLDMKLNDACGVWPWVRSRGNGFMWLWMQRWADEHFFWVHTQSWYSMHLRRVGKLLRMLLTFAKFCHTWRHVLTGLKLYTTGWAQNHMIQWRHPHTKYAVSIIPTDPAPTWPFPPIMAHFSFPCDFPF